MANRNYPSNKVYNAHVQLVQLDCQVTIGASGAVSSFTGKMIKAVSKLATGIYSIQLQDNYAALYQIDGSAVSPTTGSSVTAGSFVTGTSYRITSLGTTNFAAIGLPAGLTPAIGMVFVATGAGSGTGTALAVGNSGISSVEQLGNSVGMLNNQPAVANAGGYIYIQTLGPTSATNTASIPTNPVSGTVLNFVMILNNSQVQ